MSKLKKEILISKSVKKVKNVTEVFLGGVYSALEVFGSLTAGRYSVYGSLRKGAFSQWSESDLSKTMYDMEHRGYIKHDRKSDSIELTNKARIRIIDQISKKHEVDGKYRFVSFDIPEQKRSSRDNFRRALKRIGFVQVQKSLWVCERNVGDLVEEIIKEYSVDKYVTYIISEKSDIDEFIKKKFKH